MYLTSVRTETRNMVNRRDAHPGPGVEHLDAVAVGVGEQRRGDLPLVLHQRVVTGVPVTLRSATSGQDQETQLYNKAAKVQARS